MAAAASTSKPAAVNVPSGTNWEDALLALLGAPKTAANYSFLNAWATREHGASYPSSLYANNPFFTTAGGSGTAGPYKAGAFPTIPNTPGVTMFPDLTEGTLATADTLEGGGYSGIVAAIKSGNPEQYASNPTFQQELSTWSGSGYNAVDAAAAPAVAEGPTIPVPIEGVSAADAGSIDITGSGGGPSAANIVGNAVGISSVTGLIGWITNTKNLQRVGEMLGGGVLILLGIVIIGKGAASSGPAQQTAGAVQTVAAPVKAARPSNRQRRPAGPVPRAAREGTPKPKTRSYTLPADRKPARGAPGSSRLAKGDTIPF